MPPCRAKLSAALTQWVQTDFETRLENPAQQFGTEQMMRFLGSSSVIGLPGLITESSTKIDRTSANLDRPPQEPVDREPRASPY